MSLVVAHPARPTTARGDVRVGFGPRVSVSARGITGDASRVLAGGAWVEVVRIDAVPHSACVVQGQAVGDRTDECFVRDAMGEAGASVEVHRTISRGGRGAGARASSRSRSRPRSGGREHVGFPCRLLHSRPLPRDGCSRRRGLLVRVHHQSSLDGFSTRTERRSRLPSPRLHRRHIGSLSVPSPPSMLATPCPRSHVLPAVIHSRHRPWWWRHWPRQAQRRPPVRVSSAVQSARRRRWSAPYCGLVTAFASASIEPSASVRGSGRGAGRAQVGLWRPPMRLAWCST